VLIPAVTIADPSTSRDFTPAEEVNRISYKYLPGDNPPVTPLVIAIATSPVPAVMLTVKAVEDVAVGCFFSFASPLNPVRLEAFPLDSVDLKVSSKFDPCGILMLITGFAAMILF
jgi:hypothetical protein|tara:strand:+ start:229 stop:573 length:345 start_codon:yes stop_codon:yes gene_type:complete